jgi:hypothetical protein
MNQKNFSKLISYQKVVAIIKKHLDKLDNIHSFCKEHNLNYTRVIAVKNGYRKPYPNVAKKLLQIFGYDVSTETAFDIKGKKKL